MKCNLFINYYVDPNPERRQELDNCLFKNMLTGSVDNIIAVCSIEDYRILKAKTVIHHRSEKLIPIIWHRRPTYNDLFAMMRYFDSPENLNIICNTDIVIPTSTIELAPLYLKYRGHCLALSRWDVFDPLNYQGSAVLFDRADSQDTWMFLGGVGATEGADFTLGIAGCDNRIAYLLEHRGYTVLNPSRKLRTYHYHLSGIRNYMQGDRPAHTISGPYKLIAPSW